MMFWLLVVGIAVCLLIIRLNSEYVITALFAKRLKTADRSPIELLVPTPKSRSKFGAAFDQFGLNGVELFQYDRLMAAQMKKSYVCYIMGTTFYNIITPEDAEMVVNDPNLITKGLAYSFLKPFIRTGLLTSTDKKWHARRKMITPTFHFDILNQFEEVFKSESQKFCKQMLDANKEVISLRDVIPRFTLNSICETALGVELDEQLDADEYRRSFKMIEQCFVERVANPFFMFDGIYNIFAGSRYWKSLKKVHAFSSAIIDKRRQLLDHSNEVDASTEEDSDEYFKKKKRYAMLDTLLMAEKQGLIDHTGICEEVDTFMFEGFDTTSMGLTFGLMNLSLHPEVQERCYQEIMENIDPDLNELNIAQLNKLKYMDCFIKETIRMYPPVPEIMRKIPRETKLANNVILPAGTEMYIHIFDIHRNAKHFPSPHDFNPDRFAPENAIGRHPYAFMPFSAGQRNCIGQKFAMLEMKTFYVYMLSKFKILPMMDPKELQFESGIILRVKNDITVRLVKRNEN